MCLHIIQISYFKIAVHTMTDESTPEGSIDVGLCQDGRGACQHKNDGCKEAVPKINSFSWSVSGTKIAFGVTCGVAGVWPISSDTAHRIRSQANWNEPEPAMLTSWFPCSGEDPIASFDTKSTYYQFNCTSNCISVRQPYSVPEHNAKPYLAAAHSSSRYLAAAYKLKKDGCYSVGIWMPGRSPEWFKLDQEPTSIAWANARNMLAIGLRDGSVSIFRPIDMNLIDKKKKFNTAVTGLSWSTDDGILSYCSVGSNKVSFWTSHGQSNIPDIQNELCVMSVAIMGHGDRVAAKNKDGIINIWSIDTGSWQKISSYRDDIIQTSPIRMPLAFSPGTTLLSSYNDKKKSVIVRDVMTAKG